MKLQKLVIILPDDAEPGIGDLVKYKAHDNRYYFDLYGPAAYLWSDIKIVQRQGKPVIYQSQLEGE